MTVDSRCNEKNEDVLRMESTATLDVLGIGEQDKNTYDPFEHRRVPHPISTMGSFFNLLKSSLGSGLLAMPAAFKHTGLIPGALGTVFVAMIATHCVHILVQTSRDICQECKIASLSYTDTCVKVFKHGPNKLRKYAQFMRHFVDYAMAGVCFGGTSVYVNFIASSLKNIWDYFYPEQKYSVEFYCAVLLFPLILLTQIRYLKFFVPFSFIANVCLISTFVITCYYTFIDITDISKVKLATNVQEWSLFLSTAIFAMEGINIVMPVENEMANPKRFLGCPGVLNSTMSLVVILYGIVGIFGYLKYGDEVLGSVTLNLPEDEMLALSAKILVAIAVFFTYGLQMYAPFDIMWTRLKPSISQKYHNISQIVLRVLSVIITVALAAAVPELELLIGLVGAIFFSTLGLLIPVVIQTVHKWERGLGPLFYILWKNIFLILFYLIVLVSGCYSSVSAIFTKYSL